MSIPDYTTQSKNPLSDCKTPSERASDQACQIVHISTRPKTEPSTPPKKGSGFKAKYLGEVKGVEVYESTVVVKRHGISHEHEHKRGEVTELSASSLARLAFIAFNTEAHFPSMMTLTYPDEFTNEGDDVKQDLKAFLEWFRRNYPGEKYLWWLEFQRRGAPHFHILTTVDLSQQGELTSIRRSDGTYWQTNWDSFQMLEQAWGKLGGGFTAWEVINDADGGKKYAAKYATKAYQKAVPEDYRNVGRFWGHSRDGVKPEVKAFYRCNEQMLREALEAGGWEHLPDEGRHIFPELYQAADKIDYDKLAYAPNLDTLTHEELVWAETGQQPRLVLRDDQEPELPPRGYTCQACGTKSLKWSGQCEACQEWHSLIAGQPNQNSTLSGSTGQKMASEGQIALDLTSENGPGDANLTHSNHSPPNTEVNQWLKASIPLSTVTAKKWASSSSSNPKRSKAPPPRSP